MDTGKLAGQPLPRSSGVDARSVVLAIVDDTVGSLAALLLATEIAAAQQGRLHIAHVSPPRVWLGGMAGIAEPTDLMAEADDAAAAELYAKAADVVALGPPVEWTFSWTRGLVHKTVARLISELSPTAVVLSAPRRHRSCMHPSLARWLIGRPRVQAVVVPA